MYMFKMSFENVSPGVGRHPQEVWAAASTPSLVGSRGPGTSLSHSEPLILLFKKKIAVQGCFRLVPPRSTLNGPADRVLGWLPRLTTQAQNGIPQVERSERKL